MAKDTVVDPAARDKYLLQVTAGPTYDPTTHEDVPVNGPDSITIESHLVTCYLKVRIKDYHGLPHNSPSTSPYFQHKLHTSDRYSIAFSFVPKIDLSGSDVVLGFDYDHSIKHQLPPGFKYAMKIATSMLDPGLYSDPYSDNPYLYGPALSGLFTLNIGERTDEVSAEEQLASLDKLTGGVVEEGATGSGRSIRDTQNLPSKWKKRRKHFLDAQALSEFTFEQGRMYHADFFNPHLDFANFALRLPGFSISVAKYIDEKTHHLRYVLKNRATDEVLFVVFFKLLFGEELERIEREKTRVEKNGEGEVDSKVEGNGQERIVEGTTNATNTDDRKSALDTPEQLSKLKTIEKGQPSAQAQSSVAKQESDNEEIGDLANGVVTSLKNSIYAALVAMGFWDDDASSSESQASSGDASPQPSSQSLDAEVDHMNDSTVEQYLQSRQGNA